MTDLIKNHKIYTLLVMIMNPKREANESNNCHQVGCQYRQVYRTLTLFLCFFTKINPSHVVLFHIHILIS